MSITYTGNLVTPTYGSPSLADLSVQLMRIVRFAGAGRQFWTVGMHSLVVADLLRLRGCTPYVRLLGLLHDGHEALTSDVPRPWKVEQVRQQQHIVQIRLLTSLGLRYPSATEQAHVDKADRDSGAVEAYAETGPSLFHRTFQHVLSYDAQQAHDRYANDPLCRPDEMCLPTGCWPRVFYEAGASLLREVENQYNNGSGGEPRDPVATVVAEPAASCVR